jgi:hypothetical protein
MGNEQLFNESKTNITDVQTTGNITIAQIKYESKEVENIISLESAFKSNSVTITELKEQQVNAVELHNLSNSYIFILDGDIIKGAKQNRVINTSILVAPKGKAIIPVSCIEEGRWDDTDDNFNYSMHIAHNSIRYDKLNQINNKNKKEFNFRASQQTVWNNVEKNIHCLVAESPTKSHTDMFEKFNVDLESMTNHFDIHKDSNGILIFVNNKLISCEIFNSKKLYSDYFNKILISAAMEAKIKNNIKVSDKIDLQKAKIKLKNIFKEYQDNIDNVKSNKAVCEGNEMRLNSNDRSYYGLIFSNEAIHKNIQAKLD